MFWLEMLRSKSQSMALSILCVFRRCWALIQRSPLPSNRAQPRKLEHPGQSLKRAFVSSSTCDCHLPHCLSIESFRLQGSDGRILPSTRSLELRNSQFEPHFYRIIGQPQTVSKRKFQTCQTHVAVSTRPLPAAAKFPFFTGLTRTATPSDLRCHPV